MPTKKHDFDSREWHGEKVTKERLRKGSTKNIRPCGGGEGRLVRAAR